MTMIQHPRCKACNLPVKDRKALDKALVTGSPVTKLTQLYGLSRDVLYRHRAHIHGTMVEGGRRALQNHGSNLLEAMLEKMNELTARTESLLDQAEEKDQVRNALLAVQQLRNNYQTMGTIVTSMGQSGLGLDPTELEEFRQWKEEKDNIDLSIWSEEDKLLLRDLCIARLSSTNSIQDLENFRSNSWLVQESVSDEDIEELKSGFEDDQAPIPTQGGESGILTGTNEPEEQEPDPPMRRTKF